MPDAESEARAAADARSARVWVVFVDLIANRVFFECGIVDRLHQAFPQLTAVFRVHPKHVQSWLGALGDADVIFEDELMSWRASFGERLARRIDRELDDRIGFYPLALRHSLRHGFHGDRVAPGHPFPFHDSSRVGPLPRWDVVEHGMRRWHLSKRRYVPSALCERLSTDCDLLVLTNPQTPLSMPFVTAARRLGLPTIAYIASWDHPVGKGVVSPYMDRYVVQNETMRDNLVRFHGLDAGRIVVAGWPQTDVYAEQRPREEFEALVSGLGLPTDRPVVLFAGSAPNNSPYEGNLVSKLVTWWRETGSNERFSLLFRPHPYDRQIDTRYAAALADPEAVVQRTALADLDDLATLLGHVDAVVATGGTILLESIANDRPTVCIAFDEGAPPGRRWASLNLEGWHYRELLESDAFERAESFDDLVHALRRSLAAPADRAAQRQRIATELVGDVDGRAADRVVAAIRDVAATRELLVRG
jgi:CDP-Glycerol:Poly(glycerophosphate) glycerophosphotransferase